MFVTPPSRRHGDGRGHAGGRRSDGTMPTGTTTAEEKMGLGVEGPVKTTEGPLPPKPGPSQRQAAEPDHLQRAFEAEMVTFLREQNAMLMDEVES